VVDALLLALGRLLWIGFDARALFVGFCGTAFRLCDDLTVRES
jgi:hypothetical protein